MTAPRPTATKTPRPDKEQVLERFALMDKAIRQTDVQLDELESALGMYMIGFHFGWKVLHVIHSKKTIAKYETILGIKIREAFPEYGPDADRTNAYKIIQSVSNFWKLVSGDERSPVELDKRSLSQ
ncbi:hypothetical protein D3C71_1467320 [compost metagenome]